MQRILLSYVLLFPVVCCAADGLIKSMDLGTMRKQGHVSEPSNAEKGQNGTDSESIDLYLDVYLHGTPRGIKQFVYNKGRISATADVLSDIGIAPPTEEGNLVFLDTIPNLQIEYNQQSQSIFFETTSPERLSLPVSTLDLSNRPTGRSQSSNGVLLNYDAYGTSDRSEAQRNLNVFTELRGFSDRFIAINTALSRFANRSTDMIEKNQTIRLDTSVETSFEEEMISFRVGDVVTRSLLWSRPTRIGGVQLTRNFALQPYQITAPLPAFLGSAAVPSNIELFVDGVRQFNGSVPMGPFVLNALPGINGSGNALVVMTDTLGRTTSLSFPFYSSNTLLKKGLADWGVELGKVRNAYGLKSFDYGDDLVGSGIFRYGVSEDVTLEMHGEFTEGLNKYGVGGSIAPLQLGVISGSIARSSASEHSGEQWSLGYNWNNKYFSFNASETRASSGYRDIASLYDARLIRRNSSIFAGYHHQEMGSIGLGYINLDYDREGSTRLATASWFKSIGKGVFLNLAMNQNLDRSSERTIFLGMNFSFDHQVGVATGISRDHDQNVITMDASKTPPIAGGIGWRTAARLSEGQRGGGQAEVIYLGRYGQVSVGASSYENNHYAFAGASGALVWMGDNIFAARRIDDAFGVVSTGQMSDIPVLLENRLIGKTDEKGVLLVAPLHSYQENQVSIDTMKLPPGYQIDRVKALAKPGGRAGSLVEFGIRPAYAASIVLVDPEGNKLPIGSEVFLHDKPERTIVGFDGMVYLQGLKRHNVLNVSPPKTARKDKNLKPCTADFEYETQVNDVAQIGAVVCREKSEP